eukprot:s6980_g2.t1
MAKASFGPGSLQSRSCLLLFETDSGNVRQGRDRCSSVNIQVAGDTPLLQVFAPGACWRPVLLSGSRATCSFSALTARPGVFEYLANFRYDRSTQRAQRTQRPATVHQIRPSLPWCSTLPALRRKLCRGFCL